MTTKLTNSATAKPISKFTAVLSCKCPRCRQGDIFAGPIYSLTLKEQHTNEYCSVCQLRFEREPGFFYVAMFVSYAMNVAEMIATGLLVYVMGLSLVYENLWWYVGAVLLPVFLLGPVNYRYSRVILLHWLTPGLGYESRFHSAYSNQGRKDS